MLHRDTLPSATAAPYAAATAAGPSLATRDTCQSWISRRSAVDQRPGQGSGHVGQNGYVIELPTWRVGPFLSLSCTQSLSVSLSILWRNDTLIKEVFRIPSLPFTITGVGYVSLSDLRPRIRTRSPQSGVHNFL
ncbi:unnamed protein product [Arctogadus glacialis]